MEKNKKNRKGVMYSTNPDFEFEYENEKMDTCLLYTSDAADE